jgi:peptidoglycan/LPS O-acetylase OafA/YrhL
MLIGYDQASIFDGALQLLGLSSLPSINDAADAPLWSLHAEFWGSMSVLVMVAAYRRLNRYAFWGAFVAAFLVSGSSWFSLFMIGFAAYLFRAQLPRRGGILKGAFGAAMFALGLLLSFETTGALVDLVRCIARELSSFHMRLDWRFQGELSAVLMLTGITITKTGRAIMSIQLLSRLGKISFSLYLIHFPILFTVGCSVFLATNAYFSYGAAVLVTATSVGLVTILLATQFERLIDRTSTRIASRVARFNLPPSSPERQSPATPL